MEFSSTPRDIDVLLARYAESHRNPVNELIHFVCIPAIVFSLLGILWAIHPIVALAVVAAALVYYTRLSRPFALGMAAMAAVMLGLLNMLPVGTVLVTSIGVFVLAWIGQFIGHHIEGKKPSFFDDLRFLLIGPLFVLSFLYRRMRLAY
ncbi:Mpo1-like protein [Massilia sp. CFBP9012]|uniref:Mpo1 family 2-hydroxy fatty acid dioxygenase n=1 Tax=Massilia sp. CFBP9012 TaxID=3096531 RepID=UPI002A69C52C|nr:Mpo1-like protein [Massilia sp. CFBP9012]MDY0975376.1 Mpo1-like protein [Massilia sp. CFBP9012]